MKTRAIQWTLVSFVWLFLVNCNAFVLESTTWVTAVAKESAEAKDETHIRRIAKLDGPSDDHHNFPDLEQIINLVTVKDPDEQLPSKELKPLTYKDLCQILGNYHISKQSNHYDLVENSGKMQHN